MIWVLLIVLIWIYYRISQIKDDGPTRSKKREWSPFMKAYNASPLRKAYLKAVKPKPLPSTVMRRNRKKRKSEVQQ